MKVPYLAVLLFFVFLFQGCKKNLESRNPAEIVSRDADTVFNDVPGKQHLGKETFKYNIVEVLHSIRKTNIFIRGLEETGLIDTLTSKGPFTVFAPADEAFNKREKDTANAQQQQKQQEVNFSKRMMKSYIVPGRYTTDDLAGGSITIENLNGEKIQLKLDGENLIVNNNIRVSEKNLGATNGVIHEIDTLFQTR